MTDFFLPKAKHVEGGLSYFSVIFIEFNRFFITWWLYGPGPFNKKLSLKNTSGVWSGPLPDPSEVIEGA